MRVTRSLFALVLLSATGCGEVDSVVAGPGADTAETTEDVADDIGPPDSTGLPDSSGDSDTIDPDDAGDAAQQDVGPGVDDNFGVVEKEGRAACENLLTTHCILPFPSDFFRRTDGGTARLDFSGGVLPISTGDLPMSFDGLAENDGFGITTPILVWLEGATVTGTPPVFEPEASLETESLTVVLDATTGDRVAHWAEADYLSILEGDEQLIALRSARAWQPGHRYVVAIRGLTDKDGAFVAPSAGFAALRDGTASHVRGIHARRQHFETDIFPVLAAAGVERADLQLAFDFTTASEENATRTLFSMRNTLLEAIGEAGPEYTITAIEPGDSPYALRVRGVAQVPSFLHPADSNGLRRLRRNEAGLPVIVGTESVAFDLHIPESVVADPGKAAVMQYGHGFLGERSEAGNGWLREFANREGFLVLAADMQGMSDDQVPIWGSNLLVDAGRFPFLKEPAMQGIMNHLALVRMMKGRFRAEAAPELSPGGKSLYDGERFYYHGNSQGGTLGTLIMALTTDIARGGLGVPGCAFPMLLHRSTAFSTWVGVLEASYDDPLDLSLVLALLGSGFNQFDGLSFAPHVRSSEEPGSIPHEVLLHVGKEDAQVHNQVSFLLARAIGAVLVTPAVRSVWGLEESAYPLPTGQSALVELDYGWPDNPDPSAPPPAEHDTHSGPRASPEAQEQLWHFLETGEVISVCDGSCDPT